MIEFFNYKTKSTYNLVENKNPDAVSYIQDTSEIIARGKTYSCIKECNLSDLDNMISDIKNADTTNKIYLLTKYCGMYIVKDSSDNLIGTLSVMTNSNKSIVVQQFYTSLLLNEYGVFSDTTPVNTYLWEKISSVSKDTIPENITEKWENILDRKIDGGTF